MSECLPVELEERVEMVKAPPCSIGDVKKKFDGIIVLGREVESLIEISKTKCEEAEISVQEAKSYESKWYKIGSGKKKINLMAKSQAEHMEATMLLQQGQALLFKFQRYLAEFCMVCLSISSKNKKQLDQLSSIIVEIMERAQTEDIPEVVVSEVRNLKEKVEKEKRVKEKEQKRHNSLGNHNILIACGFIIIFLLSCIICLLICR